MDTSPAFAVPEPESVPRLAQLSLLGAEPLAQQLGLTERFGAPPFTVLDRRAGYWRDRRRRWLQLGLRSEEGRPAGLLSKGGGAMDGAWAKAHGYTVHWRTAGVSVFDPVTCELVYRWWCPAGGRVLDPFAGGSVRGLVASALGLRYVGCDLSAAQVEANELQAEEVMPLLPRGSPRPRWVVGDSRFLIDTLARAEAPTSYDLVFTCPPYYDLERYSDDPADLSNAESYAAFLYGYQVAVAQALELLAPDRFACWVVGDIRAGSGELRGLVGDTTAAHTAHGAQLWNDAILVSPVGTLAVRAAMTFPPQRKLGRSHQHLQVYVKGSGRAAAAACPPADTRVAWEEW